MLRVSFDPMACCPCGALPQVAGAMASTLTSVECASSTEGRPYMFGLPWAIPGYIEAENYDYGGHGVSDHNS